MAKLRNRSRGDHRYRHIGELLPPTGFDTLVTVSVGLEGPVALWTAAGGLAELLGRYEVPGGASFANTRTSSPPPGALARYSSASLAPQAVTIMAGVPVAYPLVQPLPGGDYLVVGGRCRWTERGAEKNGLVVGADGAIKRAGTLGDGIEHLLVDGFGDVWIGYSDEGIFGNFGWGRTGPTPLGSHGIVRWSTHFERLWEYEPVDGYDCDDCYALNVGPDRTWACPYTDFPVVEIRADGVSVHPTQGVSGPSGLVVADDTVGLIGGYGARGALRLGSMSDGLNRVTKSELRMSNNRRVPAGELICRGSIANLFVGTNWFTFDLSSSL